jgi:hypothetical protein
MFLPIAGRFASIRRLTKQQKPFAGLKASPARSIARMGTIDVAPTQFTSISQSINSFQFSRSQRITIHPGRDQTRKFGRLVCALLPTDEVAALRRSRPA